MPENDTIKGDSVAGENPCGVAASATEAAARAKTDLNNMMRYY